MLTQNEITSLSLSPTKKDFVQIWNELLEVAGNLSERWDPTSTNESDPGIVILKALAGIADKLNYNIDKNTLEAFMPTAAQEDSMRKLCSMLGYNIKYYQSAKTKISIKYHNSDPSEEEAELLANGLLLPKFSVITNNDQDISYVTLNPKPIYITAESPTITDLECIEGQIVKCEGVNDNNIITANQISEDNRFYLPETQIAENGIFVYNIYDGSPLSEEGVLDDGTPWEKVDNLNVEVQGSRVYKFGYDSYEGRPYIEFPDDYSELFNDGIFIYYTRTSGAAGNISPKTLTRLETPSTGGWDKVATESISVENAFSANTGCNIESIRQAYNNFKKTIGTFDTLVTCRDYMNKIYRMVDSIDNPIVSNIRVTDIRNDLNRSLVICSCDRAGIFYKETPIVTEVVKEGKIRDGSGTDVVANVVTKEPAIDHFDLILYPFKSYNQIKTNVRDVKSVYDNSFSYSPSTYKEVTRHLLAENIKTIAHNVKEPRINDIISINNYLRLNATIATNSKITIEEGSIIIDKVKIALANAFNMRELDFGEEIPFDSIVDVIENADSRIRVASLNEPALYTTFSVYKGLDKEGIPIIKEYAVASDDYLTIDMAKESGRFNIGKYTVDESNNTVNLSTFNTTEARQIYNKLAVRNVLAGRVPLFDYNDTFSTTFTEGAYQVTEQISQTLLPSTFPAVTEQNKAVTMVSNDVIYTGRFLGFAEKTDEEGTTVKQPVIKYTKTFVPNLFTENYLSKVEENYITDIETSCKIAANNNVISNVKLETGEFVKFRAPNFTTIKTYPAYVNYHLELNKESLSAGEYAEALSLFEVLNKDKDSWSLDKKDNRWQRVLNFFKARDLAEGRTEESSYRKIITQQQKISAYAGAADLTNDPCTSADNTSGQHIDDGTGKCAFCKKSLMSPVTKGPIIIKIGDSDATEGPENLIDTLNKSGCIKLSDRHAITYNKETRLYEVRAILNWFDDGINPTPGGEVPLDIRISLTSPFITDASVISKITESVQTRLEEMVGQVDAELQPLLPGYDWTIAFEYEAVPFVPLSLGAWRDFIKENMTLLELGSRVDEDGEGVTDGLPVFWRVYGEGYTVGKYILQSSEKLLKFDSEYFGLLPESRLMGIYLISYFGKDAQPAIIKNNEEYKLRAGEHLYIEYTPSSTSEDGTTQELPAVREVLGPGTIIRPSGFELGLIDSSVLNSQGTSYHKSVDFENESGAKITVQMHRFGANEQVEVRDFAQVILNKDSFKGASGIYYYKNFDCDALDSIAVSNALRTYTLKDGEYIFYTDQNKLEFAYFTTGTQVTIKNKRLERCEPMELANIFDSGISSIPWKFLPFADGEELIFQEYQYITLGAEDLIKTLELVSNNNIEYLDSTWRYCDGVQYVLAGEEESTDLPNINTYDTRIDHSKGCGWEVCSVLELDVSKDYMQALRNTEQVLTSITLYSTDAFGAISNDKIEIVPEPGHTLYFKTNLNCQSSSTRLNIKDIYSNSKKLAGFEFKFFSKEAPALVKTVPGTIIPDDPSVDIANWLGEPLSLKTNSALWKEINLEDLRVDQHEENTPSVLFDGALKLPVSLLPNTYGVFSVYLDYTTEDLTDAEVWIETMPGSSKEDFSIFNVAANENIWDSSSRKLFLKPGINCIRVNKTGRVFIKAAKKAQGSLFFDELKLVKCDSIELTNALDGSKAIPVNTYGLNTTQLGYLNPEESTSFTDVLVDEKLRKTLKTGRVDESLQTLTDLGKELDDAYKSFVDEDLSDVASKIATMKARLEKAKEEITNLKAAYASSTNNANKYLELFKKYNELEQELLKEEVLLEQLTDIGDLESLEDTLNDVLTTHFNFSDTLQKLLDEVNYFKETAYTEVTKLTPSQIREHFATATTAAEHRAELCEESRYLVNREYAEQLQKLTSEATAAVNSEDKAALQAAVNTIKDATMLESRLALLTKVQQVLSAADNTELNSYLDSMLLYANAPDYKQLCATLVRLRSFLANKNYNDLIVELERAVADSNDAQLKIVLDSLTSVSGAGTTTINNKINTLVNTTLPGKFTSETVDSDITKDINSLYAEISSTFNTRLTNLITTTKEQLTTVTNLISTHNSLLADMQATTNSQMDSFIADVKTLNAINKSRLHKIEGLTTNGSLTALPFYEEAVVRIWSSKMIDSLHTSIDDKATTLANAILTPTTTVGSLSLNPGYFPVSSRLLDQLILDVNDLINRNQLKEARVDAVWDNADIKLPESSKLTEAVTSLEASSNTVLTSLITTYKAATTVKQQHEAAMKIKAELAVDILLLQKGLDTIAKLTVPSILSGNVEDDFYTTFNNTFTGYKDTLLKAKTTSALTTAINSVHTDIYSFYGSGNTVEAFLNAVELGGLSQWLADDIDENMSKVFNADFIEVLAKQSYDLNTIRLINDVKSKRDAIIALRPTEIVDGLAGAMTTWIDANLTDCDAENPVRLELNSLGLDLRSLSVLNTIDTESKDAYNKLLIEELLLADLREIDSSRDFYYTAPNNLSLAIEFNESDAKLNTLMNPLLNYDINNVNNNFVISKLDIGYLDSGLKIARSSRLN